MRKGELTRTRIIELAAPLFNERGFAGCSIADVMEATGLEKGGIYRHFGSKEELALAAYEYAIEETHRMRSKGLEKHPDAVSKLRHIITSFGTPISGGCPYLNAAVDSDDGNPEIREMARKAFQKWHSEIVRIVKDGISAGLFISTLEASELADTLMATLEGALMLSRVQGTRAPMKNAQRMLESVVQSYLHP